MNNSNKHDRNFNNQVNHLHSFIGMPMWNGRNPSISEIRAFNRRLLEQQALEKQVLEQKAVKFDLKKKRFINFVKEFFLGKTIDLNNRLDHQKKTNIECCD